MASDVTPTQPIAIVGVSALFPDSINAGGFWQNILDGRDLITDVPPSHWLIDDYFDPDPGDADKTYCKRGGFLPDVDFDPVAFGIPPNVIPATDTTQLLALIVARQVLTDAFSSQFETMDKEKMSIILGVTAGQELLLQAASRLQRPQWLAALREEGVAEPEAQKICDRIADKYTPWQESTFPGLLGNVVAGRIANRFDLGGTNCVTDAACASSLSALSMGINELYLGHSDVVITGGVDCFNDIFMYMCFTKTPALSRSGDCRPFADGADGTLMGEGMGMFALKRLKDAEEDGDQIYSVIKGMGSSSDGRSLSVYAPLPEGQAKALTRAHERAGVTADTVELVEAHGTATKAGDVAEFQGLKHAFSDPAFSDPESANKPWCALGSVKSQIGHTKAAAGAAGLFKVVMGLHHRTLPPTIKVGRPNPKLLVEDSPFYINSQARPWIRGSDHPRRAGLSSFGFGGSNFHVVLEEYTGPGKRPARSRTLPAEVLVFSADSGEALQQKLQAVLDELTELPERHEERRELLSFLAHQSQSEFDADADHRFTLTATDLGDLGKKLSTATSKLSDGDDEFSLPTGAFYRNATRSHQKIGFLFPGQGSQYVNMGADRAMTFDRARAVWDEAADLDFPLHRTVFPPPAFDDETKEAQKKELTKTEWAQPAIGAESCAQLALLDALGLQPDALGGHSFGEITALHAAGVYDRQTMLRIARKRGELMAQAARSTTGAMTAVRTSAQNLAPLIEDENIVIANDNSPTQVVISGAIDEIETIEARLDEELLAYARLPVATAFHSPIVAEATAPFSDFLYGLDLDEPRVPVYANTTAKPYASDADSIRENLTEQIENPVRFVEMIQKMYDDGVRTFIEVGPGGVLSGLVSRCLHNQDHQTVTLDNRSKNGVQTLSLALANLSSLGLSLDYSTLWEGYAEPEDPRLRQRSKFTVKLNGANFDRPYPPAGGSKDVPPPNPPASSPQPYTNGGLNHGPTMSTQNKNPNSATNGHVTNGHATNGHAPDKQAHGHAATQQQPPQQQQQQAGPGGPADPAAAHAFAAYQRSMAESHMAYLRLMEESVAQAQMAYMQAMETSFRQWCAGGQATPVQPQPPLQNHPAPRPANGAINGFTNGAHHPYSPPTQQVPGTVQNGAPNHPQPYYSSPSPAPYQNGATHAPQVPGTVQNGTPNHPQTHYSSPSPAPHINGAPTSPQVPGTVTSPPESGPDITTVMLSVVAEKTGYPTEMLDASMALEADLGIDSIKRVEILSAVQEEVPALPELDPGEMATLKTLGEITEYLDGLAGSGSSATNSSTTNGTALNSTPSAEPSPPSASPPQDLSTIFMAVVAEKTGYPTEMLDTSMALEADLGIDSIKRVEILSAVQDQVPSLPELDPTAMATLKTVGEIVGYLEGFDTPQGGSRLGKPEPSPAAPTIPARFVPQLVEAPAAGLNLLTASPITIIDDETGVGAALVRILAKRGYAASLSDDADQAPQIIDLRGLRDLSSIDDALAVQRDAFHTARSIAGSSGGPVQTYVIAWNTGGTFGLKQDPGTTQNPAQSWIGGLAGLAKTANLEWPDATVKALDLATPEAKKAAEQKKAQATLIADELTDGGPEVEVAFDPSGARYTIHSVRQELDLTDPKLSIDDSDIVVASGGARGVTARCLIELARRAQPTIVLLGRSPLQNEPPSCKTATTDAQIKRALLKDAVAEDRKVTPAELGKKASNILKSREVRATIDAIKEAGSQVRYATADVRDRDALRAALKEVRTDFGSPTVIVHAAGVLADKRIQEKTDDQFDFVFDTKVDGLRSLLEVTADDPIKALCLFSSVAARTGNIGQVDYSMANETLNKVAYAEAGRRGIFARSLNWGPWDGGMVDDSLRAHFESRGVSLIDLHGGAIAFCNEFTSGNSNTTEVVLGDGLPEASDNTRALIAIDAISHPYLSGHTIDGNVVLPATFVLHNLTRLAISARPGLHLQKIRDFRVLKGITLEGFDDVSKSHRFVAVAHPSPADKTSLTLQLQNLDGAAHYSATAEFGPETPTVEPLDTPEEFGKTRWDADTVYEYYLFHSEDFKVLTEIEGLGHTIARAILNDSTPAVLLDAGLQLALVQGIAHDGRSNLPTALATFTDLGVSSPETPVELITHTREISAHKTVTDIDFRDATGSTIFAIRGLEMFFRGESLT